MLLVSLYFILGVFTTTCTGRAKSNCANNKCEMLVTTEICTQCNAGFVPIGGVCTAHGDPTVVAGTGAGCQKAGDTAVDGGSTVCEKCTEANYFLFMGGCYKTGEAPGTLICTAAASGKCSACVENGSVFKNKNSSPTLGTECILCSDDTGSNGNKGVANCATCTAPSAESGTATCKTCMPEFALDGSANACKPPPSFQCAGDKLVLLGTTEICTQCNAGFVPIGGVCTAHGDPTVVAGTGAGCQKAGDTAVDGGSTVCEKCTEANYFLFMGGCYKTGEAPGTLICTAAASGKCSACVENGSVFKNKNSSPTLGTECILCSDDTGSNGNKGVANCATCTAPSAESGTATCKTCMPEFALDGSANACKPPPSFQCAGDKLVLLGTTEICTQCNAGFVPIGGVCTAHGDPTVVAGTGAGCQKAGDTAVDGGSTVCEKCTEANYFLFMGGCYKTGEAPGTLICTAAASGKCSACVENGSVFKNKNSSPTLGTECILCSDDTGSNGNKGVANCATCTAPSAESGTATCKTCMPEFALDGSANACTSNSGTGGNTNRGGLSTGAIAGIAVAVVIVVGGLVGFLCWWFLCRGKA